METSISERDPAGAVSGDELLKTPAEEMDRRIAAFEAAHPESAKRLGCFLSGGRHNQITAEDVRKIKFLAYNAEEPYRSIFLNSLAKFRIGNADLNNGARYCRVIHTVDYSYPDDFSEDPRGPYTTVFHECGHAIDDLSDKSKWWGSDTENYTAFSRTLGRAVSLREAIEYDVYYNPENLHSVTSIADEVIAGKRSGCEGDLRKVIRAFQSGKTDKLTNEDLNLFNAVKNRFLRTARSGPHGEASSDVYGGMSCNILRKGYGHEKSYWRNKRRAGRELWAEFFSYHMAGNTENLKNLTEYFPEASGVMTEYAAALGAQRKTALTEADNADRGG